MLDRGIFALAAGAVWGILSVLPYLVSQITPTRGVLLWASLPGYLALVLPDQIPPIHLWLTQNWYIATLLTPVRILLSPILGILIVSFLVWLVQKVLSWFI